MRVEKIELNDEGIQELMKSSEMQKICSEYASQAVGSLGSGYAYDTLVGKTRCNADVHATTHKTKKAAINDGTIYKAVFK